MCVEEEEASLPARRKRAELGRWALLPFLTPSSPLRPESPRAPAADLLPFQTRLCVVSGFLFSDVQTLLVFYSLI